MNYEKFFTRDTKNYKSLKSALLLLYEQQVFIQEVENCIIETIDEIVNFKNQSLTATLQQKDEEINGLRERLSTENIIQLLINYDCMCHDCDGATDWEETRDSAKCISEELLNNQ